jgi:DNA-binding LacI/PurR family transcriptional regulator
MKVGLKDVAKGAGVAVSTVSHVLNGTAPISEEVRERVLAVARQLGYLEHRRARTAFTSPLSGLVLAMPADTAREDQLNLFTLTVLRAFRRACADRSIKVVPHVSAGPLIDPEAVAALIDGRTVQAAVVVNDDRPEFLRLMAATGAPVVLLNGEDPEMAIDTVTPANRFAAATATRYLMQMGHRRILHLTWNGRQTIRRRVDGYHDAHRSFGLTVDDGLIVDAGGYRPEDAAAAIERLIAEDPPLRGATAIFCAADNLAFGTLDTLARHDIRVPFDVSVFGFDDVPTSELARPPLSTVHVPLDLMGPAALNLIEQRLLTRDPQPVAARLELGCRLVHRASVASPT